jgi:hypothetical protein
MPPLKRQGAYLNIKMINCIVTVNWCVGAGTFQGWLAQVVGLVSPMEERPPPLDVILHQQVGKKSQCLPPHQLMAVTEQP